MLGSSPPPPHFGAVTRILLDLAPRCNPSPRSRGTMACPHPTIPSKASEIFTRDFVVLLPFRSEIRKGKSTYSIASYILYSILHSFFYTLLHPIYCIPYSIPFSILYCILYTVFHTPLFLFLYSIASYTLLSYQLKQVVALFLVTNTKYSLVQS